MDPRRTSLATSVMTLLASQLIGCQPPVAQTAQPHPAQRKQPAPDEALACDAHFAPGGELGDELAALVRMCSAPRRERELSPVRDARQGQGDAVDRYAFTAEKGRCFRLYALGDADVLDIDAQIVGPGGQVLAADTTRLGHAVVPSGEPICATEAGTYVVEVSVARGAGRYMMQVWTR